MTSTVTPIAYEVAADTEEECAQACADLTAAQPANIRCNSSRPAHGGDGLWRSIVTLRREPPREDLPDWCIS